VLCCAVLCEAAQQVASCRAVLCCAVLCEAAQQVASCRAVLCELRLHELSPPLALSVAVLLWNKTRDAFVLVKQFRPAVYMMRNHQVWEGHEQFAHGLSWKGEGKPPSAKKPTLSADDPPLAYGPGQDGITYELCAGIVDKSLPLEEVVQEEVLEETGYRVPLHCIEPVCFYHSSVGVSGTMQWLYYAEVSDSMLETQGGGNEGEGEMIEVVHLPVKESLEFVFDASQPKPTSVCFAMLWWNQTKKPPQPPHTEDASR